jgi:hypothetical protein
VELNRPDDAQESDNHCHDHAYEKQFCHDNFDAQSGPKFQRDSVVPLTSSACWLSGREISSAGKESSSAGQRPEGVELVVIAVLVRR